MTTRQSMDIRDYIKVYKTDLPESFLENLIKRNPQFRVTVVGEDRRVDLDKRHCSACHLIDAENKLVWTEVDKYLRVYRDEVQDVDLQISQNEDGYHVVRYTTGCFYKQHTDMGNKYNRVLSIVILLNDDFSGGELAFFNAKYVIPLKKNDMVIFPSNFMYPHQVMPVTSGTRYTLVTWVS